MSHTMPDPIASKITEKAPSYEDCNKHETRMLEHLWHMYTIFQHKIKRRYRRRRKDTKNYIDFQYQMATNQKNLNGRDILLHSNCSDDISADV